MRFIDLRGKTFNRLEVLRRLPTLNKRTLWECRCSCGKIVPVEASNLKNGHAKSCGCFNIEQVRVRSITHGQTGTVLHNTWRRILNRCHNTKSADYKDYGGRGIRVHQAWIDSFQAFAEYVGPRPASGYSIDRYPNNDGNYEPGNVRWATAKDQANNRREQAARDRGADGRFRSAA